MSSKVTSQAIQKKSGLGSPPPSTPHATLTGAPLTAALALPTTKSAVVQGNALKVDNK